MNAVTKIAPGPLPGGQGNPVLAFVCDEETVDAVCRAVPGGRAGIEVKTGGIAAASAAVADGAAPALLIVDVAQSVEPAQDVSRLIAACGPATTVVAVGSQNDVALYRGLMAAGVSDYLLKPIDPQDLRRTMLTVTKSEEASSGAAAGRLITVVGARGGVGASSVATSLAWRLASDHGRRVALVDLDLQFGTIALGLDLEPGNGLRNALEHPERIDSLFVASAMTNYGDNLFVMAGEEPLDERSAVRDEAVELLLEQLRRIFDVVVVDLPRSLTTGAPCPLRTADTVILVTDITLPGLRDAARLQAGMAGIGAGSVDIVVNRIGRAKAAELSVAEFEKGLGTKVSIRIPEDPRAGKPTLRGLPLAAETPRSKVALTLAGLARVAGAVEDVKPKGFRWPRLKG
ncbi:MAG: AAA family ATPase [Inquilinaceae bacterium]